MRLPHTHKATATTGFDAGGHFVEYYADTGNGDGYGEHPLIQRWYGTRDECERRAASGEAPHGGWLPLDGYAEGPDRLDPGYWRDNF